MTTSKKVHQLPETEIIYEINGIDSEEGLSIREATKVMQSFEDLVLESNRTLGNEEILRVKVKPFKEGSFVFEFITGFIPSAVTIFASDPALAMSSLLSALGFITGKTPSLPDIVKQFKGRITQVKKQEDGSYLVKGDNGQVIEVEKNVGDLMINPTINNYFGSFISPLVSNEDATSVNIQGKESLEQAPSASFSKEDVASFRNAAESVEKLNVEQLEDEPNVYISRGVILNPEIGPYSGGEGKYKFSYGDTVYSNVTIEDEELLRMLRSGDIRFYCKDSLNVDIETTQTKRKHSTHKIIKLNKYYPYEDPIQSSLEIKD